MIDIDIAEKIRKSETLRIEINKDLYNCCLNNCNNNIDFINILKKAIKCISIMTSDDLFFVENIKKLEKYQENKK